MSDAGFPPVSPYTQQPVAVPTLITSEERNLSMLAHVLMILTGFIAPLIIFFVKRDSKFVRYHSLMALFWQILVTFLWMLLMGVFVATMFADIFSQAQRIADAPPGAPPPAAPAAFPLAVVMFWGAGALTWMLNFLFGIVFGIKAYEGKWSGYPVIKRLAAKAAGL